MILFDEVQCAPCLLVASEGLKRKMQTGTVIRRFYALFDFN